MSSTIEPRRGAWIQTYLGVQFFPLDPRLEDIRLLDIAHALSNICRFTGHCKAFYSVAQHAVLVSQQVPPEDAAWGLLHDAAEAYIADLSRPIKVASLLGDKYREIEDRLMKAVCLKFGLSPVEPISVKIADNRMLMTEKRDLLGPSPAPWGYVQGEDAEPLPITIIPVMPMMARHLFLRRAEELGL